MSESSANGVSMDLLYMYAVYLWDIGQALMWEWGGANGFDVGTSPPKAHVHSQYYAFNLDCGELTI